MRSQLTLFVALVVATLTATHCEAETNRKFQCNNGRSFVQEGNHWFVEEKDGSRRDATFRLETEAYTELFDQKANVGVRIYVDRAECNEGRGWGPWPGSNGSWEEGSGNLDSSNVDDDTNLGNEFSDVFDMDGIGDNGNEISKIFRCESGRTFINESGQWYVEEKDGSRRKAVFRSKNHEFTELFDVEANVSVRLYQDRAECDEGRGWGPWPGSNGSWDEN